MSDLPAGWTRATLGELGRWTGGGTPSKSVPEFWRGDIPWVSAKDMKVDRIRDAIDHISEEAVERSATRVVPTDSVLVVTRSGILQHTLPVAVTDAPVALNQDLKALVPAAGVDAAYVAWLLRANARRILSECAKSGTTVSNIETTRLLRFSAPLAPLAEQRRIVAAIEEQLSRLDAAVATLRTVQVRSAMARRAVLAAAFSRYRFKVPLNEAADPQRPICYGILKPRTTGDLVVPYVEVRSIRDGRIDLDSLHRTTLALHREFARSTLRPGDVVVAVRGSWDRAAVVPAELEDANVSRDVARIAPLPQMSAQFLSYFLSSPVAGAYFASVARGVGVRGVNIGDLRQLPVPCPALEEQAAAVEHIEAGLDAVDWAAHSAAIAIRRAESLRRSILTTAFRGGLVPQNEDDEPASVMLERISAECDAAPKPVRPRREKASA